MCSSRWATLLAFLAFLAPAWTTRFPGDDLDRDVAVIRKCNASSPVTRESINSVLISKILLDKNDYGFKCFLYCVYQEYGWMTRHGGFRLEAMKGFLEDSGLARRSIRKLLAVCTHREEKDRCERAYEYTQCFWSEVKKAHVMETDELGFLDDYDDSFLRKSDSINE